MEKKKKLKLLTISGHTSNTNFQPAQNSGYISVDGIMEMTDLLGLTFDGDKAVLKQRIQDILIGQKLDWDNHNQ